MPLWFNQVFMTLQASCLLKACAVCQSALFSPGHPIDPRPLIVHLVALRAIRAQAETKFCILPALPLPIQSIRPICPLPCFLPCGKWAPTVAGSHYAMRQDDVGSLLHFFFFHLACTKGFAFTHMTTQSFRKEESCCYVTLSLKILPYFTFILWLSLQHDTTHRSEGPSNPHYTVG